MFHRVFVIGSLALCCVLFAVENGHAQRRTPGKQDASKTDCVLEGAGESTVLSVLAPQTLHLADGRYVRLAEVLVPTANAPGFDPSLAAANYLKGAALGRKVEVKFGGTRRDRYGIYVGHLFVAGEPVTWLQQGLVSAGYAEVSPQADNHACSRQLLAYEAQSRLEKRGHWGLALLKVLQAKDTRSLYSLTQTYQIVEGRVRTATEGGGRLALHMGAEGKFEFTATLEPSVTRSLITEKSAQAWSGAQIRVRGWLESKHGPFMSIAEREQIEIIASDDHGSP